MKRIPFFLLLWIIGLSWGSCSSGQEPTVWRTADSLVQVCPDSAWALLDSLRPQLVREGKEAQMRYALLRFQARDRAHRPLPPEASDSLVRALVRHYEKAEDPRRLAEVYYYAGRVLYRAEDATQALDYLVKSLTTLPAQGATDLRGRVVSCIGSLYLAQGLYRDALKMLKEGVRCDSLVGDTIGWAYNLQDMGQCHYHLGEYDRELQCYLQACQLAEQVSRMDLVHSVRNRLATAYIYRGQFDLARKYLQNSSLDSARAGKNIVYIREALGFYDRDGADSAMWRYKDVLVWEDAHSAGIVYTPNSLPGLKSVSKIPKEKDRNGPLAHLRNYQTLADSLLQITGMEEAAWQDALSNYRSPEQENIRLRQANKRGRDLFLRILLVAACLFAGAVLYHLYRRRQLTVQLRVARQLNEDIYRRSEDFIESNNRQIGRLEEQIRELSRQLEDTTEARKRLEQEKVLVTYANLESEALQGQRNVIDSLFLSDERCRRFKQLLDEGASPTPADWEALGRLADKSYDGFTQKLARLCNLRSRDLHICLLAKMGWGDTDIARLVPLSPEGVASVCRRLHAKAFPEEKPSSAAWHKFILSL